MGRRNKKGDPVSGWVNFDKPYGMTSTQAVGKIRRLMNAQKVGHAGTLDPLATGVLPIALGEATKTIPYAQDAEKTYHFTITWGEQRRTDDIEGEVIAQSDHRPTRAQIEDALPTYIGEIEQIPPQFSAIKIDGQRAYDIARDGGEVELKSRIVFIDSLKLLSADHDTATFEMTCGKGTYVRSLARDMGIALETYGHVSMLRRMHVGVFTAEDAISLDKIETLDYGAARDVALLPLQTVLDDIPALALKADEMAKLRNGQGFSLISRADFTRLSDIGLGTKDCLDAFAHIHGEPVALIENERADIYPVRVFNITKL